jgi:hypothetical protein
MNEKMVARLLEKIEATARLAEMATNGSWVFRETRDGGCVDVHPTTRGGYVIEPTEDIAPTDLWHIAHHHPKSVLVRCDADRKIVWRYQQSIEQVQECKRRMAEGDGTAMTTASLTIALQILKAAHHSLETVVEDLAQGYGVTEYLDVTEVRNLARQAHAGQVDKAGRPYFEHVEAVAELLDEHGDDAQIAGLLHDVIEDTSLTSWDLLKAGVRPYVVEAVLAVTRRPDETYMDMIRRATVHPLGRLVKLADNTHNSDPARLAALDPQDAAKLAKRYTKARQILAVPKAMACGASWKHASHHWHDSATDQECSCPGETQRRPTTEET